MDFFNKELKGSDQRREHEVFPETHQNIHPSMVLVSRNTRLRETPPAFERLAWLFRRWTRKRKTLAVELCLANTPPGLRFWENPPSAMAWTPSSWRALPKHQMAEWEDKVAAEKVFAKLGAWAWRLAEWAGVCFLHARRCWSIGGLR